MIQDIFPHIYHNEFAPRSAQKGDFLLCYRRGEVLCAVEGEHVCLPTCGELGYYDGQFLFVVDDTAYFLWEGEELPETAKMQYRKTRQLRELSPDDHLFACGVGESLWRWYQNNRYCGHCGNPMEKGTVERSMVCPSCKNTVYPKICPAVMVAITDGDKLLLTRYANRPFQKYALVAGFNEIGESIEDTVRREVKEEVGLSVKDLQFYRSQPWVFTDCLLMGFFCRVDGSTAITREESELAEAVWISREDIPDDYSHISLAGEMISLFRAGNEPK